MPLNYRHERYVWVPREAMGALRGADIEVRGLLVYLAKFCDPKTGVLGLAEDVPAFRALTLLCAVHPEERRAFRDLVPRLLRRPGVALDNGRLTLADVPTWQRTREPARRIYATEPPAFARLPAYARFLAAELIRSADDHGVCWMGTTESFARHFGMVATAHRRHDQRALVRARLADAARALVGEGFLVADAHLTVKNFVAAQTRLPDASLTGPGRLPDASLTGPGRLPDASLTGPGRLPDASRSVTHRIRSTQPARFGPFPTLPTLPTLPEIQGAEREAVPPADFQVDQGVLPGVGAGRPTRVVKRRSAPLLPFAIEDALKALEGEARGRFVAGEREHWTVNQRRRIEGHIQRFPVLDAWRRVGQWLAEGGDAWRKVVGPGWVASDAFADAMVRASKRRVAPADTEARPGYLDPLGGT